MKLTETIKVLQGIEQGKSWQFSGAPDGPWHDAAASHCPLYCASQIYIRFKPWTLPAPPEGRQWHREDWTEEMLPPVTDGGLPWRPLMEGEERVVGDFFYPTAGSETWVGQWQISEESPGFRTRIVNSDDFHSRTRRPIHPSPVMVPIGPDDVPPGSFIESPLSEDRYWYAILSVHQDGFTYAHRKDLRFMTFEAARYAVKILRPGGEWTRCEKPQEAAK